MVQHLLKALGVITVLLGLISCENQERIFPDFDYTTTYFPYQYPVRTLVLGDYAFDNSNDNASKFLITATMGGVYENKEDILVDFVVDESLADNLYLGDKKLRALPRNYYTLSHDSQFIIPKGKLFGGVEVRLNDSFYADSSTAGHLGTNYVVPLRIVKATTDSVLVGSPIVINADLRVAGNWQSQPKHFTLFGINYVNEYHGKYLMRGRSQMVRDNAVIETTVYRNKYVEKDEVVDINTTSRRGVTYKHRIPRSTGSSPGEFEMVISFDEAGNGRIAPTAASAFPVSGTARFAKNAEIWGGEKRHALYLDYQVSEGRNVHMAKDTLVFRDKAVSFQEFLPTVR